MNVKFIAAGDVNEWSSQTKLGCNTNPEWCVQLFMNESFPLLQRVIGHFSPTSVNMAAHVVQTETVFLESENCIFLSSFSNKKKVTAVMKFMSRQGPINFW